MRPLSLAAGLFALTACGTRTGSAVTFTVDDDAETFTDLEHDGIVVECRGDAESVWVSMARTLFDDIKGPTFRVEMTLGGYGGEPPDEGAEYRVADLRPGIGYHGDVWPRDHGTVTVTDFVAVNEVNRVAVTLSGVGDGERISLDGEIVCVR